MLRRWTAIDPLVEAPACGRAGSSDGEAAASVFAALPQYRRVSRLLLRRHRFGRRQLRLRRTCLLIVEIAHPQLFLSASRDGSCTGFTSSPLTMLRKLFQPASTTWVT